MWYVAQSGPQLARSCQPLTSATRSSRIPFYSYIRLLFVLYLVLPQTQGARIIYQEHIHPWMVENEAAIDDFIASAHERLKTAGIAYLKRAIELLKTNVLGLPPDESATGPSTPPSTASAQSYTQALLARFSLPAARWTASVSSGSAGTDFYNLLAGAVAAATSGSGTSEDDAAKMSASGTLIPPTIRGTAEKATFIAAQRERLAILLSALDKEARQLETDHGTQLQQAGNRPRYTSSINFDGATDEPRPPSGLGGLTPLAKSRSEADFEKIDAESGAEDDQSGRVRHRSPASGSWLAWGWGASATPGDESAQSSGVEK